MDTATGLTVLGTAVGSAKLVGKLLGPTADYIGMGLKEWTSKRVKNIATIFNVAAKRLGTAVDEPGQVPPKVLRNVLEEGSFCDDELSAEYYGGVLASSRSTISRDDRGSCFLSIVTRLSTYQLRAHYVFYKTYIDLYCPPDFNLYDGLQRNRKGVLMPFEVFHPAMQMNEKEIETDVSTHVLNGLARESLLARHWAIGHDDYLTRWMTESVSGCGVIYAASIVGLELYMWAMGMGQKAIGQFMNSVDDRPAIPGIEISAGSRRIEITGPNNGLERTGDPRTDPQSARP